MASADVRHLGPGANQQGLRDHNARLLLSTLQRRGPMPASDLARLAGLSPQTVSVILRSLDADGLVARGEPQRGRIGKPSVPVSLAPDGAFAFGLKIGRRSADLLLVDFAGRLRGERHTTYRWPEPDEILRFLREGLGSLRQDLPEPWLDRIAGIGVAMPSEIWHWHETIGAPLGALDAWRGFDLVQAVGEFCDLPVLMANDGTAAARAEHIFGRGREFGAYAYFFVGSFIGGGIVLNHSVVEGPTGNAAAFGSLPAPGPGGRCRQLIETASLFLLEEAIRRANLPAERLWAQPQDWSVFGAILERWITRTAGEIARAAVTVCAVIDFEAVLVDGAMPAEVRTALVAQIRTALKRFDMRGLAPVRIEEGTIGAPARALGAAAAPLLARHLLDTHAGAPFA